MPVELTDVVCRHHRLSREIRRSGTESPACSRQRQTRQRPSLYDEAVRAALIVLWGVSNRVCGKRLRPLLPILLPGLEHHGHLRLQKTVRSPVLSMSAATMDRILRAPRNATRRPSLAEPS
jgi:hypothetical protein